MLEPPANISRSNDQATPRPQQPRLKLALMGPSGSGKSTSTRLLADTLTRRGLTVSVLKIAQPLYELQAHVYRTAGRPIEFWAQDQVLLEDLARHLRRIRPSALVDDFLARVGASTADVVVNDDLRDVVVDYPALRAAGFVVVAVQASEARRAKRLAARRDISSVHDSETTRGLVDLRPDHIIRNDFSSPEPLSEAVDRLVAELL